MGTKGFQGTVQELGTEKVIMIIKMLLKLMTIMVIDQLNLMKQLPTALRLGINILLIIFTIKVNREMIIKDELVVLRKHIQKFLLN